MIPFFAYLRKNFYITIIIAKQPNSFFFFFLIETISHAYILVYGQRSMHFCFP